jgi:hypothetical protein
MEQFQSKFSVRKKFLTNQMLNVWTSNFGGNCCNTHLSINK